MSPFAEPLSALISYSPDKVGQYPVGVGMNLKKGLSCDVHTIPTSVMKGKGEEYIWDPSPLLGSRCDFGSQVLTVDL